MNLAPIEDRFEEHLYGRLTDVDHVSDGMVAIADSIRSAQKDSSCVECGELSAYTPGSSRPSRQGGSSS